MRDDRAKDPREEWATQTLISAIVVTRNLEEMQEMAEKILLVREEAKDRIRGVFEEHLIKLFKQLVDRTKEKPVGERVIAAKEVWKRCLDFEYMDPKIRQQVEREVRAYISSCYYA